MTLRVVADNVTELPVGNVMNIPEMMRFLADDIETGDYGNVCSLISLVVRDDGIGILTYGENCSHYELMGLFEAAKLRVFAEETIED